MRTTHSVSPHALVHPRVPNLPIRDLLGAFAERHGRDLTPRARRQVHELIDGLADYLEERGVRAIASTGRPGVVTQTGLLAWLDSFELHELPELIDPGRDSRRTADAAMRALARRISAMR